MPLKTLFLLSLANINKLEIYFNNVTNYLIISTGKYIFII
jgi:hypothetical protein